MGCVCSKGPATKDDATDNEGERQRESNRSSVQAAAPSCGEEVRAVGCISEGSVHSICKPAPENSLHHPKGFTNDSGVNGASLASTSEIMSMPHATKGEQSAAGWPFWLSSVAAEAIQGWLPRSTESYLEMEQVSSRSVSLDCLATIFLLMLTWFNAND